MPDEVAVYRGCGSSGYQRVGKENVGTLKNERFILQ